MAITESGVTIIYTEKGISVERITFDSEFWNKELLPKLIDFYDNWHPRLFVQYMY